jgi:hypothetical protein
MLGTGLRSVIRGITVRSQPRQIVPILGKKNIRHKKELVEWLKV